MSLHIIIIDDSKAMRAMISRTLQLSNIEIASIREAGNGQEALRIIQEAPPDLAILDLNMPIMDGEQFLATARSMDAFKSLPVLIASTETNHTRIRRLKLMGAQFVHKPFRVEDFCAALENVIVRKAELP